MGTKLTRNWSANIFIRQDLENDELISKGGSVVYEDECAKFAFNAEKEYSDDPEEEDNNEFEFYFTFYLKTLGGMGEK